MSYSHEDIKKILVDRMRETLSTPSCQRENFPHMVRCVGESPCEMDNSVIWASVSTLEDYRELVTTQKRFYADLGKSFEWKYWQLFQPEALKKILLEEGFEEGEREELLVWHSGLPFPEVNSRLRVREVQIPEELPLLAIIQEKLWRKDLRGFIRRLEEEKAARPDSLHVFGATTETGEMIATGLMRIEGDLVMLHAGATLPEYRRQGAFTKLVRTRLELAKQIGAKLVGVDASPRSLPILLKMGFLSLGETIPFVYH